MQRIRTQDRTRQLGLTALLVEAESTNLGYRFARDTAHLRGTVKEGEHHKAWETR